MPTPSCCDRLTIRVVLLKVSPLVARLISVPDDLSLEELHDVLQQRVTKICTRPKASLSQSHSWPLLSTTSQQMIVSTRRLRPMKSKFSGCFFSSFRCSRRYSGSCTMSQQRNNASPPAGKLI